ncbi:hypothetical protein CVD28_01050 [Bacillus sp. M6-12]|uniref:serine/threonine protein kinase n=1 Tax=Bacillus sp. M6-12 TaxID=2054166 RepID=UPI000C77E299|nr:serine/threonine protein kinase [Bacillus sp. M6-12]PLS19021.1 hypothetical protein CVD28_01050 [Bacillus sp. M6-12]
MEEEILFIQDISEEEKEMLQTGIKNLKEILEEEQGALTFGLYDPTRMYPFQFMAEGNYGIIFQYKHYVIKYIKEYSWEEEELEHEASIYLKLQGINQIPTLYGYSYRFLIMEKLEGSIVQEGFVPEDLEHFRQQIRESAEAILDKGYIPFDIEFFITREGKVKVLDMGLFQSYTDPSQKERHLKSVCQLWDTYLGVKEKKE